MLLKHPIDMFPFQRVSQGSRIVLWGMGQVGRRYLGQLVATGYCQVEYAVDACKESICMSSVPVYFPEYICTHRIFDFVVISISNQTVAAQVRSQLIAWGIDEKKIVYDMRRYMEVSNFSDNRLILPNMEFYREVRHLLKIYHTTKETFVRIGSQHDGGYVMLDDFRNNGVAYSFGINDDISWDIAMEEIGYDVFMYDHTIDSIPEVRKGFHFFRRGLAGADVTEDKDRLDHFLIRNGHASKKHMILKMDIEGDEWEFLANISSKILRQFDQIVMEMHGFLLIEFVEKIINGLEKLNWTHFVVHVHANNCGNEILQNSLRMTDALEVTWACRDVYEMKNVDVVLPLELDAPCADWAPDVDLGRWNDEF